MHVLQKNCSTKAVSLLIIYGLFLASAEALLSRFYLCFRHRVQIDVIRLIGHWIISTLTPLVTRCVGINRPISVEFAAGNRTTHFLHRL